MPQAGLNELVTIAELVKCQQEPALSLAVLKARRESVAFVKEEFIDKHLNKKQQESPKKDGKPGKGKKRGTVNRHHQAQLTYAEMEILREYYYHGLFRGSRAMSFLCNMTALALIIFSISVPIWIRIPHKVEPFGDEYLYELSIFQNCTSPLARGYHSSLLSDLRGLASGIEKGVVALKKTRLPSMIMQKVNSNVDHQQQQDQTKHQTIIPIAFQPSPGDLFENHSEMIGVIMSKQRQERAILPPALQKNEDQSALSALTSTIVETLLEVKNETTNHTHFECHCESYLLGTWQTFLICVMFFAAMFAILAFVFSFFGACVGSLAKKLYYYHSAAEMLIVSAFLTGGAVAGFPLCIRYKVDIIVFSLGHGIYTGGAATVCYFVSGILLNLDAIIIGTVSAESPKKKSSIGAHLAFFRKHN